MPRNIREGSKVTFIDDLNDVGLYWDGSFFRRGAQVNGIITVALNYPHFE